MMRLSIRNYEYDLMNNHLSLSLLISTMHERTHVKLLGLGQQIIFSFIQSDYKLNFFHKKLDFDNLDKSQFLKEMKTL